MRAYLHLLPWVVLAAHTGLVLARVPQTVFARRLGQVAAWRAEGPARYLFRTSGREGVEAIEELLRTSPPDAVVLWRGDGHGAVEFAPMLLWPRLLAAEGSVAADAHRYLERPVAVWGDSARQAVLLAEDGSLRLVPR
jgi:hypothetical protein